MRPVAVERQRVQSGATSYNGVHQRSTHAPVLGVRIHHHRANTEDCGTLVEKIGTDDLTTPYGHYAIEARVSDQSRDHVSGDLDRREIIWESMLFGDRRERVVADTSALTSVCRGSGADSRLSLLRGHAIQDTHSASWWNLHRTRSYPS